MKVALVHDFLREYGGAERVLEVLHEMYPEAPVYTSFYYPDQMPENFRSWNIISGVIQGWPLARLLQKPFTYLVGLSFEQIDLKMYDLVISSSANFAKGVITHPGQVHINYCHTPTRFLWGLNTQTRRHWLVRQLLGPLDSWLRQWDYAAAQRVDYFIANSETTRKRIKRFYNRESEVVYPPTVPDSRRAVSAEEIAVVQKHYGLPAKYFLVVSRLMRVKNIDVVIKAFNELGMPLVVVGTGTEDAALHGLARSSVFFTGFVPDAELSAIYSGAIAFVAAAEDEDFGMTVVEAQSYGVPVIALRKGGYTESVVEGVTGLFFERLDRELLKKTVLEFEKRDWNKNAIIENALRFSKQAFIDRMRAFVTRVMV